MDINSLGIIGTYFNGFATLILAVATLYAAQVALRVYAGWREQKQAEMQSMQANNFLELINSYRTQLAKLHSGIMSFEADKSNYQELKNIEQNIRRFDTFFDELTDKKISKISNFFLNLNTYSNEIRDHMAALNKNIENEKHPQNKDNDFLTITTRFDDDPIISSKKAELMKILNYKR